jgi:hypothetical protein
MSLTKVYLRTPADIELHELVVLHLQRKPDRYMHIWELHKGPEGALFNLLQRMLDEGEITADNLSNGLITDYSMITLAGAQYRSTEVRRVRPSLHLLSLHIPFA